MKCFSAKKRALEQKTSFLRFLVFFLVSSTRAQWNQENFVKSVVKSNYKARESWCKAREAVFRPLVVIKVPI